MTALGTLAGWLAIAATVGCLLALPGCELPSPGGESGGQPRVVIRYPGNEAEIEVEAALAQPIAAEG